MADREVFSWINYQDTPTTPSNMYLGRPGERWAIEGDRCTRIDSSSVNRTGNRSYVKELEQPTEARCKACGRFHTEFYQRMRMNSPCPPTDSRLIVAEMRRAYTREESRD